MDKVWKIFIKTNAGEVIKQQKVMNDEAVKQIKSTKKLGEAVSEVDKKRKKADDEAIKNSKIIKGSFDKLIGSFLPFGDKLIEYKNNISGLGKTFDDISKSGGFFQSYATYLEDFNSSLANVSTSMNKAFGKGLGGMMKAATTGVQTIISLSKILIKNLMGFAVPLLVIVGLIFTLKRMWSLNIGGMQTEWNKLTGKLRDLWHKFIIAFDKTLRAIGPVFTVVFKAMYGVLEPFLTILEWGIDLFSKMPKSVKIVTLAVIGLAAAMWLLATNPVGAVITAAVLIFGLLPKPIKLVTIALLALVAVFWLLSANPIGLIIAGIALVVLGLVFAIKKLWEWFKKLGGVGLIFKVIGVYITGLKMLLKGVIDMFKWIIDAAAKVGKWLGFGNKEKDKEAESTKKVKEAQNRPISTSQVTKNSSNTVNNNNNVTVHSSGAISKDNAPMIGQVISSNITTSDRAGG